MVQVVPALMFFMILVINSSWVFSSSSDGFRMELIHALPQGKFTPLQLHQRAVQRSRERKAALMAKESTSSNSMSNGVQSRVGYGDAMYLMKLAIGTPPVTFLATIDTINDLTWTECQPCTQCPTQPASLFDPSKSSTFSKVPCNASICQALRKPICNASCSYFWFYGNAYTGGILATETLTLETVDGRDASFPNIGFGCSHVNQGTEHYGAVGLSRSPLSLISQFGVGKFSYCLTSYGDSKTSPIFFGSLAKLNDSSSVPLLHTSFPYYFLSLKGITVGEKLLPIPKRVFEVNQYGYGGLLMQTNGRYGFLPAVAFQLVKEEFTALLKLPIVDSLLTNGELCFVLPSNSSVKVPEFILHFEGADLELPVDNYMIHDPSTGFLCFTMLEDTDLFFLGSLQQQNMHVVYDLVGQRVSISPAQCDHL